MPNAYYWLQGGREGGQNSQKPAYVIHGCSLSKKNLSICSRRKYVTHKKIIQLKLMK